MSTHHDRSVDKFSSDAQESYTLPANMYFEPETAREEAQKIFTKSWIYIAHQSELSEPGCYVTSEIAGQRIYVIHTTSGEIKAFFNVCQHRGHSLLQGKGRAHKLITCPYHAWSYDHHGSLIGAANCDQVKDFNKADFSIPEIRVDTFAGFVFINLDPDASSMREVYAGALECLLDMCPQTQELITNRAIVFDIRGNWKNVADNLLECYHCSTAHKAFVDLVKMPEYEVELHEKWSVQWGECRPDNQAYRFDAQSAETKFVTLYLWPSFAFTKLPGTHGVATFSFAPIEAELTHQVFAYHAPDQELTTTEIKSLEYFQNVLGPEDVSLVEDVQRGLHSLGYHQGRFMVDESRSQISEHAVHHFQNLVVQALRTS